MNALLKQISETAPDDLRNLIESGHDKILKAIHEVIEESLLQEAKPKITLGFSIAVDLDTNTFESKLKWNFSQSLSVSHQIEDPAQVKLPLGIEAN